PGLESLPHAAFAELFEQLVLAELSEAGLLGPALLQCGEVSRGRAGRGQLGTDLFHERRRASCLGVVECPRRHRLAQLREEEIAAVVQSVQRARTRRASAQVFPNGVEYLGGELADVKGGQIIPAGT